MPKPVWGFHQFVHPGGRIFGDHFGQHSLCDERGTTNFALGQVQFHRNGQVVPIGGACLKVLSAGHAPDRTNLLTTGAISAARIVQRDPASFAFIAYRNQPRWTDLRARAAAQALRAVNCRASPESRRCFQRHERVRQGHSACAQADQDLSHCRDHNFTRGSAALQAGTCRSRAGGIGATFKGPSWPKPILSERTR